MEGGVVVRVCRAGGLARREEHAAEEQDITGQPEDRIPMEGFTKDKQLRFT